MTVVVKSKETKTGVLFRIYKNGKYFFTEKAFNNYFYIRKDDYLKRQEEFESQYEFAIFKTEEVISMDKHYVKISLMNNWLRNKMRKFWEETCKTYEADIMANKRFLIDMNFPLNNEEIPYLFYDIETDDRLPLEKDERGLVVPGEAKALTFSAVDYQGKEYKLKLESYTDDAEEKFLKDILAIFSQYGAISGWNSEKFDMPYLKGRMDALMINYDILEFINHMDYMELVKKYYRKSLKSYSLENVSQFFLKTGKLDQEKGGGKVYNSWLHTPDKLLEYNLEDSNLIYKLNKNLSFMEVSMKRANNAHCHIRSTMNNSDSGDYLLLRQSKIDGRICPSKPTQAEINARKDMDKISGGFTRCLKPGFFEKVEVWDFKSMYPSVIISWNISPETFITNLPRNYRKEDYSLDEYIITPENYNEETREYHPPRLYRREEGFVPKVCRDLLAKRDKIKYPMKIHKQKTLDNGEDNPEYDLEKYRSLYLEQYALKTDANSIYGILSFIMGRWYIWDVGDSVTSCCQAMIKECYDKLAEWKCEVIGGDTDSTFVILAEDKSAEDIDKLFVSFFDEYMSQFTNKGHCIIFEHEKTVAPMLFVKKKNYAYKEEDGSMVIKGLESIKTDSTIVAANLQKQFIEELFAGQYEPSKWETIVDEMYNKVFNQELNTDELILTKALTKMPHEYEGYVISKATGKPKVKADGTLQSKPKYAHVEMAERMIAAGHDLYPGSKLQYIVVHDKPVIALSIDEWKKGEGIYKMKHKKHGIIDWEFSGYYDAKYYWKRIIKPVIKVVACYHGNIPAWSWNLTQAEINKLGVEQDEE